MITPHRLTVAILIRNFCHFRELDEFKQLRNNSLSCQYRKDFCVLILKLLQSPDLSLLELRNILTSSRFKVHEEVINTFDQSLLSIYTKGTGRLLDAIDNLNRIKISFLESGGHDGGFVTRSSFIFKNSVIGYYLRRFLLNFEQLTFSEVTGVFLAFQRYYEEWKNASEIKIQTNLDLSDLGADRELWSRRQAELFIATQAALLSNNEEKALSPPELQKRIRGIFKSDPELSEAHFLSYLNYARVKEFCGAINSLYLCFDSRCATDTKRTADESKCYRYAALNLAILHYHFGHQDEALACIKEAIKIAQEANDNVCLQHALSWLYRSTTTNKDKLIVHCVLKSFELNLTYTTSLGLQMFGQYGCLMQGNPLSVFETLAKGDIVNCQHNHTDLISNSYAMKAALWNFYGKREMFSLWSQLLLFCNIDIKDPSKAFYGEGYCIALCNLANYLLGEGEYELVSIIIDFAKSRFPNEPNSLVWMLAENTLHYIRALRNEKFCEAEAAARKIIVLDKPNGLLKLAEMYLHQEDFKEANNHLDQFLSDLEETNKVKTNRNHHYIKAKILMSEIQYACGYPDVLPAGLITDLNNCLIDAQKSYLDYDAVLLQLHIANIQLLLGLPSQAMRVLDRCIVQVLAHGGCYDRGRAIMLFVKSMVAESAVLPEDMRGQVIATAAKLLNRAKAEFQQVEAFSRVKDVLFLQAQLYNAVDMKAERNRCSLEFRQLDEDFVTKNVHSLIRYL